MGLDLSAIMLEGNHVHDAPQILAAFGRRVEDAVVEQALGVNYTAQGHYEVHYRDNWTVIVDPDLGFLASDADTCRTVSEQYNCRLFTFDYGDHSNSFEFQMLDQGAIVRRWAYNDGRIEEEGDPLPEEARTEDMPPDQRVVAVMARLGVCLISGVLPEADALKESVHLFVCRSLDAKPELVPSAVASTADRPWWKLW